MCVCGMDSLENLVKVPGLLLRGKNNHAYTTYPPKFEYNFQSFSDPFEINTCRKRKIKQNKQETHYRATT